MRPVVENTALTGTVYVLLHIHMFVRSLAVFFFVLFLAIFVYRHFVILYIVLI